MPREVYDGHDYLPRSEILTYGEIERVAVVMAGLGVRTIRLTGGEPLLRRDLPILVEALADIAGIDDLALTTNGHLLAARAADLAAAGLDRITVSLDALDDATAQAMSDTDVPVAAILEAMDEAERVGLGPVKINTVVRRGWNEDQVLAIVEHARSTGRTARFIEFMDVGTTNRWDETEVVPSHELVAIISARWPVEPTERTHPGDVAETYRFVDGAGSIGFISSVSQPFCADCSRLRLSAEGSLYTCLFATDGTDLKEPIRSGVTDAELATIVADRWSRRTDRYSEVRGAVPLAEPTVRDRIEMSYIGG